MQHVKKALRILSLVLFILLAMSGMGIVNNRERYMDKEIRTEQIDKKNEEEGEESEERKG